jgi:hypothetical protein
MGLSEQAMTYALLLLIFGIVPTSQVSRGLQLQRLPGEG